MGIWRKLVFFLLLFSGSVLVYGQDSYLNIRDRGNKVFSVVFKADYQWDVSIRLMDNSGRTLATEKVFSDAFEKPFNFSNLPDGVYKFQVKYSDTKFDYEVYLGEKTAAYLTEQKVKKEKRREKRVKDKEKNPAAKDRVLISAAGEDVTIQLVDEQIEAISVFFYVNNTDEFEYYYWEPKEKNSFSYDMSKFGAVPVRVEVVEDGKILAEKEIALN